MTSCNITAVEHGDGSSIAPWYIKEFIENQFGNTNIQMYLKIWIIWWFSTLIPFLIFSFTYNSKYYQTRQLASELGVGDDNDWIYEDDDDWVSFRLINPF